MLYRQQHIGLWDYSFFDPTLGLYLIYRSKEPPRYDQSPRVFAFMAVDEIKINVPHDAIFIGSSYLPQGVIVPNAKPPPPRGWEDSYVHEGMVKRGFAWLFRNLLPF